MSKIGPEVLGLLVYDRVRWPHADKLLMVTPSVLELSDHAWDQAYDMRDEVKLLIGRPLIRAQVRDDIRGAGERHHVQEERAGRG